MQPTLPGVEELATTLEQDVVEDSGASPAISDSSTGRSTLYRADAPPGKDLDVGVGLAHGEGRAAATHRCCYQCGMVMQRAGSCYLCTSCGTTSGCS